MHGPSLRRQVCNLGGTAMRSRFEFASKRTSDALQNSDRRRPSPVSQHRIHCSSPGEGGSRYRFVKSFGVNFGQRRTSGNSTAQHELDLQDW